MLYCSCSAVQLLHCFSGTYSVTAYDFPVDESSIVLPISSQGYQSGCGGGLQLTTQGSSLSCTVATCGVLCVTQTLRQYCQNFAPNLCSKKSISETVTVIVWYGIHSHLFSRQCKSIKVAISGGKFILLNFSSVLKVNFLHSQ